MDTRQGLNITSLYDRYVLLLVLTKSYWFLPTSSVPQLFLHEGCVNEWRGGILPTCAQFFSSSREEEFSDPSTLSDLRF